MKKKILVIGDSCRDVHVYCSCDRMSPDKPVPVLKILDQNDNPGMAKNVYRNIKSLEDSCDIVTNSNWANITKTRYIHKSTNHMFFRLDSAENIKRFNIAKMNYDYDHIVISDYSKQIQTSLNLSPTGKMSSQDLDLILKTLNGEDVSGEVSQSLPVDASGKPDLDKIIASL
jgi:bifunctional ADP-heptose synthase (sugar kinase/adenylyltransferase)